MKFSISRHSETIISEKMKIVMSDFDIKPEHSNELFEGDIQIENKEWQIGMIVGSSGSGKSTIAKELFHENYINGFEYSKDSVLDNMGEYDVRDIELAFTAVGFSSPPSWLKPYSVLSTGEKMRVDLARALLNNKDLIVFDEFTSVVDREVAKTCSQAVSKHIRRTDKKFIAVSCHKDIVEYLCPDWIYDTDQKTFFGLRANIPAQQEKSVYTELANLIKTKYGEYLGSITI